MSLTAESLPNSRASKLELLRLLDERTKRDAKRSLFNFYRDYAWPAVEGNKPFLDNWHLRAMAEHLEAVTAGDIKRLLINVPFRTSKSTLVSVAWPAWVWLHDPSHQWLCGSYAEKLAIRDSLKMRRLITSPRFLCDFGSGFSLSDDQNQKVRFQNDKNGYRIAFGMTGGVMGDGGDTLLIDDPHDRNGAHSEAERETALTTYDQALITRLNDPAHGAIVIIMQRLHEQDLSGHVLKDGGWEHLMLPMEFEPHRRCVTRLGFRDPRTQEGELLWPERFPAATVASLKKTLGDYGAAGQLQQRPSPAGGGVLDTSHFQLWSRSKPLPDLHYVLQSYDTASTEKTENHPSACTVWGVFFIGDQRCVILLDAWTDYMKYPQLKKKVMADWKAEYGGVKDDHLHPSRRADVILVEEKSSGIAIIQDLRMANIPVKAYNPGRADKTARARLASPVLETDVIYVIESKRDPGLPVTWARPLLAQCEQFPNGEHDDLVDTFTQAVIYLNHADWLSTEAVPDEQPDELDYSAKRTRTNPYGA